MYQTTGQQQEIYQAQAAEIETLRTIREKMQNLGTQFMNSYVRVQTIDGQVYEGVIVGVEGGVVYLGVQNPSSDERFFSPFGFYPYYDTILPLVLYDLLAITLLYP